MYVLERMSQVYQDAMCCAVLLLFDAAYMLSTRHACNAC